MATGQRTWLALGILIAAVSGALGCGWIAREALAQDKDDSTTLVGIVGDTMCGNAHTNGPARQCTLQCLRKRRTEWGRVWGRESTRCKAKWRICRNSPAPRRRSRVFCAANR